MTHAISPSLATHNKLARVGARHSGRSLERSQRPPRSGSHSEHPLLGCYLDSHGRLREVVLRPGSAGSLLVIDRDSVTRGEGRLVAHLAPDEPPLNAILACRDYLRHPHARWCRRVTPEDLCSVPFVAEHLREIEAAAGSVDPARLRDRHGLVYRLQSLPAAAISIAEMRWCRLPAGAPAAAANAAQRASTPVRLRDVIAALESYEPVRALTAHALSQHRHDPHVSVVTLGAELERVNASRIVLNRGLREAVQRAIRTQGLSMSEITARCGRFKRDARSNLSGDTSWLARRIGLMPEGGRGVATPWIHSEVLALVARDGLGISPRDVELG
jgi:hypothetical protein